MNKSFYAQAKLNASVTTVKRRSNFSAVTSNKRRTFLTCGELKYGSMSAFKATVLSQITPHIQWHCDTFRELLITILEYLVDVKSEFELIFGGDIFERTDNISRVTIDGPLLEDSIYQ
ncbi:hypothetical protein AW40_00790 [Kosakonia radicincitans UMEnt01/12]|nr:hypothetical protein AW40_00790 [Kosakonia radicincitans UMEnt01/12]